MAFEIFEERPEIGDTVGDGIGMIGIGFSAGKSLFIAAAGGFFPVGELVPVQTVEIPSDAGAETVEVFESDVILAGRGRGGSAGDGAKHLRAQCIGGELAGIYVNIPQGIVFGG